VREIVLCQSGSGLEPAGGVGARVELFVFEGGSGGWIDDGVGARRKMALTRFAKLVWRRCRWMARFGDEDGCCADGAWRWRWHGSSLGGCFGTAQARVAGM
jgi:hypothetical protein